MRTYKFVAKDAETRDEIAQEIYEIVKYHKSYEQMEVFIFAVNGKKGEHSVALLVEDTVSADLRIVFKKIEEGCDDMAVAVQSELFSQELILPKEVIVNARWSEDVSTRRNIVIQNFIKIKEMIIDGANQDE